MAITKIKIPELFNLQSNNTQGTQLPVMTKAQRIAMTGMSNGELIFNSTTDSVEYYDAGVPAWYKIDSEPPSSGILAEYLVVAGGAAGGTYDGGGGGAGGLLTNYNGTAISLQASTNYSITVG